MKYALICGTRICEFVESEKDQFDVHDSLSWVEVADDTTTKNTYVDGKVVKFVVPDRTVAQVKSAISSALTEKVKSGIEWAFDEGSDAYPVGLEFEMREVLSAFKQLIDTGVENPHDGVLFTGGNVIGKPGDNGISDATISELCVFASLWVFKISRIAIALKFATYKMTTEQLNAFDASAIDWSVKWKKKDYPKYLDNPNWLDNRIVREP